MAILKNASIGVGTKSLGDNSYKTVRGRTIVSRRISENKSKTSAQTSQRNAFGIMCKAAKSLSAWIDQSFIKTKYGSQRNCFMKQNAKLLTYLKEYESNLTGHALTKFTQALDDGAVICIGFGSTYADAIFTQTDDALAVEVTFSRSFAIGDIVSILVAQTYSKEGTAIEGSFTYAAVKILPYTVKIEDVTGINQITLNTTKLPALATCCKPLVNYTQESIAFAVSVRSGNELSTSFLHSGTPIESGGSGEKPDDL